MKKHLYLIILCLTISSLKGFSQAIPPSINSYTDTVGSTSVVVSVSYTANDTGTIKLQLIVQQGTGHGVYDSTYSFQAPGTDSGTVQFNVGPLESCTNYQLLADISNRQAQGSLINPLFTFTTLCTTGIELLNANNYQLIVSAQSIELKTIELPENATISVYDITGRQILTAPFNQSAQQIPFNKNAGIYLLRITGNNQVLYTNRFVIN